MQGFAISPLLQEMMVYVGQMESYGNGVEVLERLAGVEVSSTQLYRVTDSYGALLEPARAPAALYAGTQAPKTTIRSHPGSTCR